jgi:hypothetical protein
MILRKSSRNVIWIQLINVNSLTVGILSIAILTFVIHLVDDSLLQHLLQVFTLEVVISMRPATMFKTAVIVGSSVVVGIVLQFLHALMGFLLPISSHTIVNASLRLHT